MRPRRDAKSNMPHFRGEYYPNVCSVASIWIPGGEQGRRRAEGQSPKPLPDKEKRTAGSAGDLERKGFQPLVAGRFSAQETAVQRHLGHRYFHS